MTLQKNPQNFHVSLQAVRNRRRRMEDRHIYYTDLNSLLNMEEVYIKSFLFVLPMQQVQFIAFIDFLIV